MPKTRKNSFADILSEFEQTSARPPSNSTKALEGTVVSISPESVFVDIGRKMDGVLPVEQSFATRPARSA
jgi:small subunit ribosomal protein S1